MQTTRESVLNDRCSGLFCLRQLMIDDDIVAHDDDGGGEEEEEED